MSSEPAPESTSEARPGAAPESAPDCAEQLRQRFPGLFGGGIKPLKLRIQADIQERAPGVFTKVALSTFFRRYTGSTAYLVAMTRSPHRFDLDGKPSGEISEEHRQAAVEELARRRSAHQAKLEQVDAARRQRAALLHDFERTTLTPANFCALKGIAPQALEALLATARREATERVDERARRARRRARGRRATRIGRVRPIQDGEMSAGIGVCAASRATRPTTPAARPGAAQAGLRRLSSR
jgi:sRNA-binding protein